MPLQEIVAPWDSQPQEWDDVALASTLANELAAAWHGGAPLVESIAGAPSYAADNASLIVYRVTAEGRSQGTSVSSANIGAAFKSYRPTPAASPFTILVRFQIRAVPGADRAAVRFENQSGETASVSLLSTGAIRGLTIRANTTVDSDTTYAAGAWITAVYTATEGNFKLWINGVRQAATGTGSLSSFQARDSISIRASDVDVVLAGFWSRALSDAEVTSISANPWQLFQRREWVPMAAASGGGVTGASSGTLQLAGSAAGSVLVSGVSSGTLAISGTSAAAVRVTGASTGALSLSGTATGTVGATGVTGQSSQTLSLTGTSTGTVGISGQSAQTLALSGTAAGSVRVSGASAGTLSLTGTATGNTTGAVTGASAGVLSLSGAATGAVRVSGGSAAVLQITGNAGAQIVVRGVSAGVLLMTGGATANNGEPEPLAIRASLSSRTRIRTDGAGTRPAQRSTASRPRQ